MRFLKILIQALIVRSDNVKKISFLFVFVVVFTLFFNIGIVSADTDIMTSGQLQDVTSGVKEYNTAYVDDTLSNSNDVVEILKAILICVRDLDIYIQFAIVIIFAGALVWFTVLKPFLYFIDI